jgi:acyl phosphate:glycerol-3-phosphate acyltransferase
MNSSLQFVLALIAAYLIGSIPMAFLVARAFGGVDIRHVGTHNVGASNVMRTTSKWLALPVILFDIGKGAFVVWAVRQLGFSTGMQAAVGISAIVGHNWPVFLKFNGGRGIATSAGVILALSLPIGLIVMVGAYLFAPFKQMGLGVFIALLALPFLSWFFAGTFGVEEKGTVTAAYVVITLIAYFRRLVHRRSELSRDTPVSELVFNRLFFDRDIRDRRLWLHREQAGEA